MKKIVFALIFASLLFVNANAKEIYYTNGVVGLTEKEYNYVKEFYGEEYLHNMTLENYKWLEELDVNNREVEIKKVTSLGHPNQVSPNGTFVEQGNVYLVISKSCGANYCTIDVLTKWLANPNVRSWDVMGARFYGTELYDQNVKTYVQDVNGTTIPSNYRFLSNGFGNSFKLPSGSNVKIEQRYNVKKGGSVFASYQHAMSTTTLAISKSYEISISGYGSVFKFTGSAVGKYDGMVGVNLDV